MTDAISQDKDPRVENLKEKWGGALPGWEQFKAASKAGRATVDKSLALQYLYTAHIAPWRKFVYGAVTVLIWLGAFPAALIAWYFFHSSGVMVFVAFFASWIFQTISQDGQRDALKDAAERDEAFYQTLVGQGAFYFAPEEDISPRMDTNKRE